MNANEFFLEQYEGLYSIVNEFVLKDLTEEEMRCPHDAQPDSIVWLLWHVARWQDCAMRVIGDENEQLLDDDWLERMNVTRRDLGNEMTHEECAAFSAEVDVDGVRAYWAAMRQRVKAIARSLPPTEWETAPEDARLWESFFDGAAGCEGVGATTSFLAGRTRAWWLSFTVWHCAQHLLGRRSCLSGLRSLQGEPTCLS